MDLIRDIIDGLFCWWLEADDNKVGCGCLVVLIVLGLVAGCAFWLGRNW